MGAFTIERVSSASPEAVWRVVTDWAGYAEWMPLTRMRVDPGPTRVGLGFAGLSGLGPLRFADSMIVTDWSPPGATGVGRFRVRKTGRLLDGWADVRVQPGAAGAGSLLVWTEEISLRPALLGRALAGLADRVNDVMFGRAVDAMVARAEATEGVPR